MFYFRYAHLLPKDEEAFEHYSASSAKRLEEVGNFWIMCVFSMFASCIDFQFHPCTLHFILVSLYIFCVLDSSFPSFPSYLGNALGRLTEFFLYMHPFLFIIVPSTSIILFCCFHSENRIFF